MKSIRKYKSFLKLLTIIGLLLIPQSEIIGQESLGKHIRTLVLDGDSVVVFPYSDELWLRVIAEQKNIYKQEADYYYRKLNRAESLVDKLIADNETLKARLNKAILDHNIALQAEQKINGNNQKAMDNLNEMLKLEKKDKRRKIIGVASGAFAVGLIVGIVVGVT